MATCDIWDVVKVPFPYVDRPIRQFRPGLVVGRPEGLDLLWVLMITTAGHRRWDGDILVSDLAVAGLPAPSMIRSAKIATIEMQDAVRIGTLSDVERPAVRRRIKDTFFAVLA